MTDVAGADVAAVRAQLGREPRGLTAGRGALSVR